MSECTLYKPVNLTAAAKAVLDNCMRVVDTQEANSKRCKVEFSYEFLDDYRDKKRDTTELSSLDAASSMDLEAGNKGFVAKWGPEVFSRTYHPLGLMVSWFDLSMI